MDIGRKNVHASGTNEVEHLDSVNEEISFPHRHHQVRKHVPWKTSIKNYQFSIFIAFLRDRIIDGFRDFDYYDRREEYARDMFERRYPPMGMRSGRERPYPAMDRMPPPPPMSMRGPSREFPSSREMFTRRSPPARSMNRGGFGIYEDFSRDSFDEMRRPSGMRGGSPTNRYAPY